MADLSARCKALRGVDVAIRIIAFLLGVVFLFGYLRFPPLGHFSFIALSHAALLFAGAFIRDGTTRSARITVIVLSSIAMLDFFYRALPDLQKEYFPPDIVTIYFVEFIVVIWRVTYRAVLTSR